MTQMMAMLINIVRDKLKCNLLFQVICFEDVVEHTERFVEKACGFLPVVKIPNDFHIRIF